MNSKKSRNWMDQLVVATLYACLGLALLYGFVTWLQPSERVPVAPFRPDYREQPLIDALTPERIDRQVAAVAAAGTPRPGERAVGRFSGSPGFYRTETLINETLRTAGIEVVAQEFQVTVPQTEVCELLDEQGVPLAGVTLYPFQPSGLLPIALPPEGVRARLAFCESTALAHLPGLAPSNMIVVTELDAAEEWSTLASAGVRALIVREDELARRLQPSPDTPAPWRKLVVNAEQDFPRFVVRGAIAPYAGREVTLRCRVVWQAKTVRNLVGVLRGRASQREALVVSVFYDSNSVVPELAPGAEQSLSLAAWLACVEALAPYRGQLSRDIVFLATAGHAQGLAGVGQALAAIEPFSPRWSDYCPVAARRADEAQQQRRAQQGLAILDALASGGIDRAQALWQAQDASCRQALAQAWQVVAGEVSLARAEDSLAARLQHLRAGSPVFRHGFDAAGASDAARQAPENSHPLLQDYLAARQAENRAAHLMTLPFQDLVQREEFRAWGYDRLARVHFQALAAAHARQARELDGLLEVRRVFDAYDRTLTLNLELYSGGARRKGDLAVLAGIGRMGSWVMPQVSEVAGAIQGFAPEARAPGAWKVVHWGPRDAEGSQERPNQHSPLLTELESEPWFLCGRQAFTLVNEAFFPPKVCTPEDTLEGMQLDVVRAQAPALGRALLSIGFGRVPFRTMAPDAQGRIRACRGVVHGSAGLAALAPSHPMGERTFVQVFSDGPARELPAVDTRGVQLYPVVAAGPDGAYARPMAFDLGRWGSVSVNAARFDASGRLAYFKDAAPAGQAVYRNEKIPVRELAVTRGSAPRPIPVSVFRCGTVALVDRGNPTTLKAFRQTVFLGRQGLSLPPRYYAGAYLQFLEPDFVFYVGFMDGASANHEILQYRSFMLNVDPAAPLMPDEGELAGRGYLTADTPLLALPHLDAAASMLRTAEKRLLLQRRYGMADAQMLDVHQRANEWLADARRRLASNEIAPAVLAADASLAGAINNHPVIRERIAQAVIGILWYLGLLVPFVFFAEKLVFGFTDIRRQLLACGVIFLAVFGLLRLFHPAFQMVRSSMVILLGFLILLLTLLTTAMVGGKFRQNLRELRRREGRVDGADVNRAGVVGTALMLGLNNMRRRKVRTGLTCITLVLITFVMICFTSVTTELADEEYATGRSSWNGLLIRNPNFGALDAAEIAGLRRLYGERHPMAQWQWLTSALRAQQMERVQNPEILLDREPATNGTDRVRRAWVNSAVRMEWNETMFTGLDRLLLTRRGWFPRPPASRTERLEAAARGYQEKNEVILPDTVARDLGLSVADVNNGPPAITIRGDVYEVRGIIDTLALGRCVGLDGQSILPFDLNSVQSFGVREERLVVPEEIGRLSPSQVVIVNRMPALKEDEQALDVACAVLFPAKPWRPAPGLPERPATGHKEQRRVVLDHLERIGAPACYAVDGISYYGSRRRTRTFTGLLELLIPVLLAALTVFNTMRGSVYERREEIYVYNAVGIAPNHVFFIFMSEACVYAVVGTMLGYLLSQGTGRVLTALHLTGGMNMEYSSIETIHVSLAIMAATLLSTVLPARDAARMASPSGGACWALPRPEGDVMTMNLPFTFTAHDRVAVIGYFARWLDANGAGSSGPFHCAPPDARLREEPAGAPDAELVPVLAGNVWLKPYDLGVSQRIEISLPLDPETGEYIACIRLRRLSGQAGTWERTVQPFLGVLRKQFLHWRVTTEAERREMFAEARALLEQAAGMEREAPHV